MAKKKRSLVALAGQQNAGKTTTYNMLTGASQHVANYPGVTVDKKVGSYREDGIFYEIVDLPGTYSLTSFSLEERVSRDFLLNDQPDLVVNVLDATALRRSLYFTFQVLEMGFPVTVAVNMMDVAQKQGITIDIGELSRQLGVDVIATVSRKGEGKKALKTSIRKNVTALKKNIPQQIDYFELEEHITALEASLGRDAGLAAVYPLRWLAIKLMEDDTEAIRIVKKAHSEGLKIVEDSIARRERFEKTQEIKTEDFIVSCRDRRAGEIEEACVVKKEGAKAPLSERLDRFILYRPLAPFFLVVTVYLIYYLSIVQGYNLTPYLWTWLAKFKVIVADILPARGMLEDSMLTSMGLWMVDSANALLIYIPVFAILFALIAILEDSGYMARIAFILDRILNSFGLHGQSTLPFILGGVFASGCAVPGIMATKGIPDERSRLATILTVPYMNCMAKIPLYTLLISIYFKEHKSWAMFFISTVTILMAMIIAKLFTSTILRTKETSPFIMEMPNYHLPTFFGVGQRTIERLWEYIKKVGSIVLAVSVCVFSLLHFPGLSDEKMLEFQTEMNLAQADFQETIAQSSYAREFQDDASILALLNYYENYRSERLNNASAAGVKRVDAKYQKENAEHFVILKPGKDKEARVVNRAVRKLSGKRKVLRNQIRKERIFSSFFGMIGRALEPVTQFAGFDWKTNIALISSFAARESSVATMGVLYQEGAEENVKLEERMSKEKIGDDPSEQSSGLHALHALALIVFFALYPPCLATTIMVKVQTGSYKWMLFSMFFATALGLVVASAIFTIGQTFNLSGIIMMKGFYFFVLAVALAIALFHKLKTDRFAVG